MPMAFKSVLGNVTTLYVVTRYWHNIDFAGNIFPADKFDDFYSKKFN